jgi:hypothetical protein
VRTRGLPNAYAVWKVAGGDRSTDGEQCRVTAPVGRSAAHMDILIDDLKLDRAERRFVSEEEITAAVRSLRERNGG